MTSNRQDRQWNLSPMITYHGGPMNGLAADDLGHATPRFSIHRKRYANSPTECGYAVYEPTPDRTEAHWAGNEWPGDVLVEEGDA